MAVTVSRPVVHDSGLGTLAQILGVYVGYQNMKTRRSRELRALNQFPEARRTVGAPDPFAGDDGKKPDTGPGFLKRQQTADETRARSEGPGLSLFPTGRPDILKPPESTVQPPVPQAGVSLATPPAPSREIPAGFAGELLDKPELFGVSADKKTPEEKALDYQSKIYKRAGSKGRDWADIKAEQMFPSLRNIPKETAPVKRIISAVSGKKNISPQVRINSIDRNIGKVSDSVRNEMKSRAVFISPTVENISEITGLNAGQTGWANKGTNALSVNYANAMLGTNSITDEIRITEQHAVTQAAFNKEMGNQNNEYDKILGKKYGIYGQRVGRTRTPYRAPKEVEWKYKDPDTGEVFRESSSTRAGAYKKFTDSGLRVDRRKLKRIDTGESDLEDIRIDKARVAFENAPDDAARVKAGATFMRINNYQQIPWMSSDGWRLVSREEYKNLIREEADATWTRDENETIASQIYGTDNWVGAVKANRATAWEPKGGRRQQSGNAEANAQPRRSTKTNPFIRKSK